MPPKLHHCDPARFTYLPTDLDLVRRHLDSFLPPDIFDAHAHLYDLRMLPAGDPPCAPSPAPEVGLRVYQQSMVRWLGDRAPRDGVFFAFPAKTLDAPAANKFLANELRDRPGSRGLLMIRPTDDPAVIEAEVAAGGWAGFKVYHLFGDRPQTQDCLIGEFLPDWAWDISHRRGLAIMLHLVRQRSLADPENQAYIRDHCRRYPGARLVLAHAARGFCGPHTVEGIDAIAGLDNAYFDTSAICEALPLDAILRVYGPSRLLFGTDFPVSELRGKAFTIGDGFCWIYEDSIDWAAWPMGQPTLVGIESILAIQQACRACRLTDGDVERIFAGNTRELYGC
jgi:glutamate-1-semialdehyde 2,1-aminomutase